MHQWIVYYSERRPAGKVGSMDESRTVGTAFESQVWAWVFRPPMSSLLGIIMPVHWVHFYKWYQNAVGESLANATSPPLRWVKERIVLDT